MPHSPPRTQGTYSGLGPPAQTLEQLPDLRAPARNGSTAHCQGGGVGQDRQLSSDGLWHPNTLQQPTPITHRG